MQVRHDGPSQESFFCVQRPILPGVTSQLSPAFAHAATGLCRDPAEPELVGQPASATSATAAIAPLTLSPPRR